jgi:hypothetical protein
MKNSKKADEPEKIEVPQEQEEQEADYRSLGLYDALELMSKGHVMSCIDNGDGYMLPGFVRLCKPEDITEALLKNTVNPNAQIVAQEQLYVNIVPMQNNECSLRFYRSKDFYPDSIWFDETQHLDELAKQSIQMHMPKNMQGN